MEAVVTRPEAMVQGLAGSPGWIAFGDNGGGELGPLAYPARYATRRIM